MDESTATIVGGGGRRSSSRLNSGASSSSASTTTVVATKPPQPSSLVGTQQEQQVNECLSNMLTSVCSDDSQGPVKMDVDNNNGSAEDTTAKPEVAATEEDAETKCDVCGCEQTLYWRRVTRTKIVCNDCFFKKTYLIQFSLDPNSAANNAASSSDEDSKEATTMRHFSPKKTRSLTKKLAKKLQKNGSSSNNNNNNSSASTTPVPVSVESNKPKEELVDSAEQQPAATAAQQQQQSNSEQESVPSTSDQASSKPTRKSVRVATIVTAAAAAAKVVSEKPTAAETAATAPKSTRSRRSQLFKGPAALPPQKLSVTTSTSSASVCTSEFVFHRGFYMQVGDIVMLRSCEAWDADTSYFAQIRAFFTDEFAQKSAVLTWLVPRSPHAADVPKRAQDFDIALFVSGPDEEFPRPLECMEFVCRITTTGSKRLLLNKGRKVDERTDDEACRLKENDLLRHKFAIEDAAQAQLKIVQKTTTTGDNKTKVEYDIKWNNK